MKQLRIHYFQHVPFEGLGYIESWANEYQHELSSTKFFHEDFILPDIHDFDWLIIMGGPMGVHDEGRYPWLKAEKEFILKAIDAQKTVIGICLGSQLIASALGVNVYPANKKEIGWYPILKTTEGQHSELLSSLPDAFTSFHWHGDTFDLPAGAIHLLQSASCPNQAFIYNDRVLGLQFHFEVTFQSLISMTENCRHELIAADYIQTENEIVSQAYRCKLSNGYLTAILNQLAQ